ncbi:MAG: phosphate acyltransferase [Candidatus Zixiibacteriota bacterium]
MIKSFEELERKTRDRIRRKRIPRMGILFPGGKKSVQAAVRAHKDGYVVTTLIGHKRFLEEKISKANLDYENFDRIDADSLEEAVKIGIEKVKAGELDFLMKNCLSVKELVNILNRPETGFLDKGMQASHIGVIQTDKYPKLMLLTDSSYNSISTPNVKIGNAQNAARLANCLGNDNPKAALLAAVEAIYPAVPVTMEEAAIAKMSERGQIKGVVIDGPLSFDVAIDNDVAKSKGIINSKVAGEADIFVAPTTAAANGVYKAMVLYAFAQSASVIYGGNVTIASSYAVDSIENTINSIILGAYLALE